MVPLLPLRDGVRALPISFFRQSMPSFYMNAPDCICSPGRLPLGAFCAGRDDLEREALHDDRISIRAPRAGCDARARRPGATAPISIHAPRAGCDHVYDFPVPAARAFQSTRPVWGATRSAKRLLRRSWKFQSTRPVWGATFGTPTPGRVTMSFNPRAPCGARPRGRHGVALRRSFNPRAPCGARPAADKSATFRHCFNPRAPCGARRGIHPSVCIGFVFQSTRPVWGATIDIVHANKICRGFNPRAPCGARP